MHFSRSLPRRTAVTAATAVTALVVTACGNDGSAAAGPPTSTRTTSAPASAPAGPHNQADVTFAQRMIPHHRQAVVMAGTAGEHASSAQVKALARKIRKEQEPEIRTMTTWLRAWGERVPHGMEGMGHGTASAMPGMMSDHAMRRLKSASGTAFDTMFLTMMIKHHQGAVAMAETEKQHGVYGPAKKMAAGVITTQTAEITRMRALLGTSSPPATTR
ncbi:DUF305 domain-containing protein [Streptomyces hygroscopicus]|uniref:DUF305 domain-containing protein n=1 Tax=Streptomyces hygroscopicus TaxID=1912 RepID=UPI000767334E|nr:DUF305 domain-containing protein [Streptomyces hygroscopicus]